MHTVTTRPQDHKVVHIVHGHVQKITTVQSSNHSQVSTQNMKYSGQNICDLLVFLNFGAHFLGGCMFFQQICAFQHISNVFPWGIDHFTPWSFIYSLEIYRVIS